jgi:IS5 family transposase
MEYFAGRTLHLEMIRYTPATARNLSLFKTPFEQSLSAKNRWVRMADLVPWDKLAGVFLSSMSQGEGRPSVDLRIVLGVLLVKHIEDLSDERTIEYIQENIYAQYFVGLSSFQVDPVFVPHLLVTIRKRLGKKGAAKMNDLLLKEASRVKAIKHRQRSSDKTPPTLPTPLQEKPESKPLEVTDSESGKAGPTKVECTPSLRNRGTLIVDATVAPSHIAYPTDTRLLSECREISEGLIDTLYQAYPTEWPVKPRTYRREAKRRSVNFSKKRRKGKKEVHKAIKNQLGYLRRNIKTLNDMLDKIERATLVCPWSHGLRRRFWILQEVYRQQLEMFKDGRRRVDDRLVSIAQPHIRPIKRGKGGGKDTEFGPKINASITEGFLRADQIDFNAFNEANLLSEQVESYQELFGYYPGTVLADKIYWTRKNRKWLKDRAINIGGVPIGRKTGQTKYEKERERKKNNKRSEVEGKFGEAKNRYGLDRLYTRLPETSQAEISLIFLAVNLVKFVREVSNGFFLVLQAILRSVLQAMAANTSLEYYSSYRLQVANSPQRCRGWNRGRTF